MTTAAFTPLVSIADTLRRIDPNKHTDYASWLKIGMACFHSNPDSLQLWVKWSSAMDNFNYEECKAKWPTFEDTADSHVGFGTLKYLAESDGEFIEDEDTEDFLQCVPRFKPLADIKAERARAFNASVLCTKDDIVPFVPQWDSQPSLEHIEAFVKAITDGKNDVTLAVTDTLHTTLFFTPADLIKWCAEKFDVTSDKGYYICINPLKPDTVSKKDEDVVSYQNCLLEFDSIELNEQVTILQKYAFPIKAVTYSGGKSIHAIINIGAKNKAEYDKRTKALKSFLDKEGIEYDKQVLNVSRYSRLPDMLRNDKRQLYLSGACGCPSFDAWQQYQQVMKAMEYYNKNAYTTDTDPARLKTETGLLGRADEPYLTKKEIFAITAPTKAGKTVFAMQCFSDLAVGRPFLFGKYIQPIQDTTKILYCDYENSPSKLIALLNNFAAEGLYTHHERERQKKNIVPLHIDPTICDGELFDLIRNEQIRTTFAEGKPYDIVVIDCLNQASSMELEKSKTAKNLIKQLMQLAEDTDVAICVIQHTTKPTKEKAETQKANPYASRAAGSHALHSGYRFGLEIEPPNNLNKKEYCVYLWGRMKEYTDLEKDYIYMQRATAGTYSKAYWTEADEPEDNEVKQVSRYEPFLNLPDCDVTGFNEAIIDVFGLDTTADNIKTTLNSYRKNIVAKGFVKRIGNSRFSRYIGVATDFERTVEAIPTIADSPYKTISFN